MEYHPSCAQKLFGLKTAPIFENNLADIESLALQEVNKRISITGVQRKLSLELVSERGPRLTIVGLWGQFIFKPPSPDYPYLPEVEALCLHLASALNIRVAQHGLMRLKSGELGYISRRFDRVGSKRLALEDLCQLTETQTSDKYYSSVEKIGSALRRYSDTPGLDLQRLLELVLYSYLIGNSDMHLKNYSLLRDEDNELGLAPAYDLVATSLLLPEDTEESALSINGRKHKLRRLDFVKLTEYLQIDQSFLTETVKRWRAKTSLLEEIISMSFIPHEYQIKLVTLIRSRFDILQSDV
jgi:serine/threonine-protein kinase HipA